MYIYIYVCVYIYIYTYIQKNIYICDMHTNADLSSLRPTIGKPPGGISWASSSEVVEEPEHRCFLLDQPPLWKNDGKIHGSLGSNGGSMVCKMMGRCWINVGEVLGKWWVKHVSGMPYTVTLPQCCDEDRPDAQKNQWFESQMISLGTNICFVWHPFHIQKMWRWKITT